MEEATPCTLSSCIFVLLGTIAVVCTRHQLLHAKRRDGAVACWMSDHVDECCSKLTRLHMCSMQHYAYDQYFSSCTNQYMAVGGVVHVDLLTPSPPAKRSRGWTMRQVTHLTHDVQVTGGVRTSSNAACCIIHTPPACFSCTVLSVVQQPAVLMGTAGNS